MITDMKKELKNVIRDLVKVEKRVVRLEKQILKEETRAKMKVSTKAEQKSASVPQQPRQKCVKKKKIVNPFN